MGFFGGSGGGASVDLASPPAIGNTTPNTGAFTTLNTSNIFGTGSPDGGVAIRNTSTATNFVEFITGVGFFKNANNIIASINRSSTKSFVTTSDGFFGWGSSTTNADAATPNASLFSDAANILAQRKGTNAQTFRLYNTFTDASNYERGFLSWTSNTFRIGTEKAGTGSQRNLEIYTDGTLRMYVTNNAVRLTNNAYLTLGTGGVLPEGGGASNYLLFRNNSGTELGRFQGNGIFSFTGTTSSFPALKPSSAVLQVRLADDSGYTVLDAQLRAQGTAPATAGATGTAGDIRYDADYIYICTATNTWKRVAIATWP